MSSTAITACSYILRALKKKKVQRSDLSSRWQIVTYMPQARLTVSETSDISIFANYQHLLQHPHYTTSWGYYRRNEVIIAY